MKFVIYFTDRKYSLSEEMKRRLKHTPWDESNKYKERAGIGTWLLCMYTFIWLNRTIFLYYMTYLYVFSWWTLMDFHCTYECIYKISYMPIHLHTLWLLCSCMYNCVCFPKCVWSCTHVLCIWILYSKLQIYMYVLNMFKSQDYSAIA